MERLILGVVILAVLLHGVCYGQDTRATTEDGRKVILKKDGSYKFVDSPKPSTVKSPASYQKPEKATAVFMPKGDRFLIWYDPSVWRHEKKSSDSDKPSFEHRDGDIGAVVLAERVEMSLEDLKEMAIANAREAAPDIRVIFEENRVVNGKNVLCMKMQGTTQGIRFVYYGYYYAGKAGVIQHLTYAPANLFSEYESVMTEFLNGLVING
jgi:hypothetical protein